MDIYASGANVALNFLFQDQNGAALTPTALSLSVFDQDQNLIAGPDPVTVPNLDDASSPDPDNDNSVDISIAGSENIVGQGRAAPSLTPGLSPGLALTDLRVVELTITTANGAFKIVQVYQIQIDQGLVVLQNSFQTYYSAVLRAQQIPSLDAWALSEQSDRVNALIEAYTRLTRFAFDVRFPASLDAQNTLGCDRYVGSRRITQAMWPLMTIDRWMTYYPEIFREAIRKAQIAEANDILSPSSAQDKRLDGITSEKVGESTTGYVPGKALDLGLSRQALKYLAGYVSLSARVSRSY